MTFRDSASSQSGRVRRSGGGGGGGRVALGGGVGGIVVVLLIVLLGGNPADFLGSSTEQDSTSTQGQSDVVGDCTGADGNTDIDCLIAITSTSLDTIWGEAMPQEFGKDYTQPPVVVFNGAVTSGCGRVSAGTGPFYCPADETVYMDTGFLQNIDRLGGSNGRLAQMYITAHEFGHHIQNITTGIRGSYNNAGDDSEIVRTELQADCYAGFWAHHAQQGEDGVLEPITQEELNQVLQTTRAIGDDTIQQHSGQGVNPDAWTHGSAAQRSEWFLRGYEGGTVEGCDSFAVADV